MKKIIFLTLFFTSMISNAATVLWAALDENSVVSTDGSTQYILDYRNNAGQYINAARIVIDDGPAPLWIPEYGGDPAYWETEYPEVCLQDEDGWYGMPKWSSQFNMEENPDNDMAVIFELGYIDWDSTDPFVTLAVAESTYGQLDLDNHIYPAGTLAPPTEANWMPTVFYANSLVPEPSTSILLLVGAGGLLLRRNCG